jgi:hypothetical protein|uniref:Uncharacterized protein n=1 Tax=viral metagenome TaxID=1070528 RepID=A0A6C0F4I9_9ZZZZ|tara:strand:- start:9557 stop:10237 length:681 start_codon:yes stop_codon:yes gene_type:complete
MLDFSEYTNDTNNYAFKIRDSIFIEGNENSIVTKGKDDICEIIIGENEIEYQTIPEIQKSDYIISKKLEIGSNITLDDIISTKYTKSIINKGLQSINNLSTILYLNEHYKINCIIHNESNGKYYETTVRNYPKITCIYKNNSWFINKNVIEETPQYSNNEELSNILNIDCDFNIYKPYLKAIGKYKVKELETMCIEKDINIKDKNGKKKLKADLYKEINLKYIKYI